MPAWSDHLTTQVRNLTASPAAAHYLWSNHFAAGIKSRLCRRITQVRAARRVSVRDRPRAELPFRGAAQELPGRSSRSGGTREMDSRLWVGEMGIVMMLARYAYAVRTYTI